MRIQVLLLPIAGILGSQSAPKLPEGGWASWLSIFPQSWAEQIATWPVLASYTNSGAVAAAKKKKNKKKKKKKSAAVVGPVHDQVSDDDEDSSDDLERAFPKLKSNGSATAALDQKMSAEDVLETERLEAERLALATLEAERLAALEEERIAAERLAALEKERIAVLEVERLAVFESKRIAAERIAALEKERIAAERIIEQERIASLEDSGEFIPVTKRGAKSSPVSSNPPRAMSVSTPKGNARGNNSGKTSGRTQANSGKARDTTVRIVSSKIDTPPRIVASVVPIAVSSDIASDNVAVRVSADLGTLMESSDEIPHIMFGSFGDVKDIGGLAIDTVGVNELDASMLIVDTSVRGGVEQSTTNGVHDIPEDIVTEQVISEMGGLAIDAAHDALVIDTSRDHSGDISGPNSLASSVVRTPLRSVNADWRTNVQWAASADALAQFTPQCSVNGPVFICAPETAPVQRMSPWTMMGDITLLLTRSDAPRFVHQAVSAQGLLADVKNVANNGLLSLEASILRVIEPLAIAPRWIYYSGAVVDGGVMGPVTQSGVEATGLTLNQYYQNGAQLSDVVGRVAQSVKSLRALHAAGFVHGSVSEYTLRLTMDFSRVLLTEFEFARFYPTSAAPQVKRCEFLYWSPFEMTGAPTMPRDDIYRVLEIVARFLVGSDVYMANVSEKAATGNLINWKLRGTVFPKLEMVSPTRSRKSPMAGPLTQALNHVRQLQLMAYPNYDFVVSQLNQVVEILHSQGL